MKQTCKYCGAEITGVVVSSGGGGFVGPGGELPQPYPIHERFTCNGPGPHGEDDKDREWFAPAPDPVRDEIQLRGL